MLHGSRVHAPAPAGWTSHQTVCPNHVLCARPLGLGKTALRKVIAGAQAQEMPSVPSTGRKRVIAIGESLFGESWFPLTHGDLSC